MELRRTSYKRERKERGGGEQKETSMCVHIDMQCPFTASYLRYGVHSGGEGAGFVEVVNR